jgi:GxxExxY protein
MGQAKKEYPNSKLTGRIIGCAMEVHRHLGNGFPEYIYQRSLALEMNFQNIGFQREYEMEVVYKDIVVGKRRADFFVENEIMVELKAVIALENVHLTQAINYLEASSKHVGLLINFGNTSLQFKRVMKPLKRNHSTS